MEPIEKVLTPAEIATAQTLLATKPAGIPQDQFDIIKNNIFNGVPQAEYILVSSAAFTAKSACLNLTLSSSTLSQVAKSRNLMPITFQWL